ncbi:MAG: 8-oxo-dGTP diphosphatase [bacterium]|nr:8-oxo-dGTP diphosphatase [bacterium]
MTICFLVRSAEDGTKLVCLAEKRRGFRQGKLNGYGGKLEEGETIEACALRETTDESGISPLQIRKVGEVYFHDPDLIHECHVFVCEQWEGEPVDTDEMVLPHWYRLEEIPFERMGQADPLWIPRVLNGERIRAKFYFDEDNRMFNPTVQLITSEEAF